MYKRQGEWYGMPFELIDWQEQIVRDIFGILKPNGYRQFNTAYIEIPKKQGKSELAAAIALYLTCGDFEHGGEVYGCASDRQQASIVFDVAVDMVEQCPALTSRIKPMLSQKRLVYKMCIRDRNCLAILCFQWPNVHCQRAKNTEKARRKRNAYNEIWN